MNIIIRYKSLGKEKYVTRAEVFQIEDLVAIQLYGSLDECVREESKRIINRLGILTEDIISIENVPDDAVSFTSEEVDSLVTIILEIRHNARVNRDFATSDLIRTRLETININVYDSCNGAFLGRKM